MEELELGYISSQTSQKLAEILRVGGRKALSQRGLSDRAMSFWASVSQLYVGSGWSGRWRRGGWGKHRPLKDYGHSSRCVTQVLTVLGGPYLLWLRKPPGPGPGFPDDWIFWSRKVLRENLEGHLGYQAFVDRNQPVNRKYPHQEQPCTIITIS